MYLGPTLHHAAPMQFHLRHTKSHHFAPSLQQKNCLLVPAGLYIKFATDSKALGMGGPTARRPWLKSGPVPLRPGPSQGAGRCRTISSCPGRPLPRFWMVLLILWLCVGGAAAGTEVAANSPAVVGGAVQTGLTAACALYAASRTICSGTKATVTVPRVVVGEDDWSGTPMEGDDLVASLPHYRAVLHSTKRISVTLPDGKELTKMAVASSRQRLRAKLQELSSVCDLQLHEDIARAQVQLHVLTRHNASFGACTNGGRRQKLQTKRSRKQQLMSARLKKKP